RHVISLINIEARFSPSGLLYFRIISVEDQRQRLVDIKSFTNLCPTHTHDRASRNGINYSLKNLSIVCEWVGDVVGEVNEVVQLGFYCLAGSRPCRDIAYHPSGEKGT